MAPDFCRRMCGINALMRYNGPKKFVANWVWPSCSLIDCQVQILCCLIRGYFVSREGRGTYLISSTAPNNPYPALLTRTSTRPCTVTASSATFLISASELAGFKARIVPPRDVICESEEAEDAEEGLRDVPITWSPFLRTSRESACPKPEETPVMR